MNRNIMSISLPTETRERLVGFAELEGYEISTEARDMLDIGMREKAVNKYARGEISLGKAAELAGLSIVDMNLLLAGRGIKNKIELTDLGRGKKVLKGLFKKKNRG